MMVSLTSLLQLISSPDNRGEWRERSKAWENVQIIYATWRRHATPITLVSNFPFHRPCSSFVPINRISYVHSFIHSTHLSLNDNYTNEWIQIPRFSSTFDSPSTNRLFSFFFSILLRGFNQVNWRWLLIERSKNEFFSRYVFNDL